MNTCDNCGVVTSQLSISPDNAAVGLEWLVCPACLYEEGDDA